MGEDLTAKAVLGRLDIPRQHLAPLPTPLHFAPRFSEAVGREIWFKRDDIGSVGYAGNKVRKLEYLAAQADVDDIQTFVVAGALQSNAARAVAALAAATGRRCVVITPGTHIPVKEPEGNHLLSLLFGAEILPSGAQEWLDIEAAAAKLAGDLTRSGERCMLLPTGCSTPTGAWAFAQAYAELADQLRSASVSRALIVHASSSGGTAAGLTLGRLLDPGPDVLGVDVGRLFPDIKSRIADLATAAAELASRPCQVTASDVTLSFDFMGPGYGIATDEGLAAIRLLARAEGIVCDPVYSGKALAAVCSDRLNAAPGPIVFWHTGGAQSVFTQQVVRELLPEHRPGHVS